MNGSCGRCCDNEYMDTTRLTEMISLLAESDPADAPAVADQITEILAGGLEGPEDESEEPAD